MMVVDIHEFKEGKDILSGKISWDGVHLRMHPGNSPILHVLLLFPVSQLSSGNPVHARDFPEIFLENLQYQYKSVSLRASAPYQEDK